MAEINLHDFFGSAPAPAEHVVAPNPIENAAGTPPAVKRGSESDIRVETERLKAYSPEQIIRANTAPSPSSDMPLYPATKEKTEALAMRSAPPAPAVLPRDLQAPLPIGNLPRVNEPRDATEGMTPEPRRIEESQGPQEQHRVPSANPSESLTEIGLPRPLNRELVHEATVTREAEITAATESSELGQLDREIDQTATNAAPRSVEAAGTTRGVSEEQLDQDIGQAAIRGDQATVQRLEREKGALVDAEIQKALEETARDNAAVSKQVDEKTQETLRQINLDLEKQLSSHRDETREASAKDLSAQAEFDRRNGEKIAKVQQEFKGWQLAHDLPKIVTVVSTQPRISEAQLRQALRELKTDAALDPSQAAFARRLLKEAHAQADAEHSLAVQRTVVGSDGTQPPILAY